MNFVVDSCNKVVICDRWLANAILFVHVCSAIFELSNPLPHSTICHYSWSLNTTQLPMNFGCSKIFAFKNYMTAWIWQLAVFSIKLFISNWCNTMTHNNRRLKLWCLAGFIMYLHSFCIVHIHSRLPWLLCMFGPYFLNAPRSDLEMMDWGLSFESSQYFKFQACDLWLICS